MPSPLLKFQIPGIRKDQSSKVDSLHYPKGVYALQIIVIVAKVKKELINRMVKPKPKNGTYQCITCEAHIEGKFSGEDKVFCYLCGNQMIVKDMVKIEKAKEFKS